MNPANGYYSLIQYCPDLSRLEAVNVGVVLFRPEPHFIGARTTTSVQRVRKFFGSADGDWELIKATWATVEERLHADGEQFRALADLERFIATRANDVQLTPPRPLKVFDPARDMEQLFRDLVGGRADGKSAVPVTSKLEEALSDARLAPLLERDVTVNVRALHRSLTVPYGFQNGRYHLIRPISFQHAQLAKAVNRACLHAVEGRSLFDHPDDDLGALQLVVVGHFPAGAAEAHAVVKDIFEENHVRLFTVGELPRLVEEIRSSGRPRRG